jgi:hypothetical protein
MAIPTSEEKLILLLLARLERISADSYWAHRASGIRGALIRFLEETRTQDLFDSQDLESLYEIGFEILENAAKQ